MTNWKEGLGPLMSALGVLDSSGNIPTLGIAKDERFVTTSWYRGERDLAPVIELPGNPFRNELHNLSDENYRDWPTWTTRGIKDTKVWQWIITHNELSKSLSQQLETFQLALDSPEGFYEFAYDFARHFTRDPFAAKDAPSFSEVLKSIDECLSYFGVRRSATIIFSPSQYTFTVPELELFREKLSAIPRNGSDIMPEPWPGPDKPWPEGRGSVMWFELYTEERLLQRTNAIFNAALRIYNGIVEKWFPSFNRRHQMSYMFPLRLEGALSLINASNRQERNNVTLAWWPKLVNTEAESGTFFELRPREQAYGSGSDERLLNAREQFLKQRGRFSHTIQQLPGYEPRPATKLAHEWLTSDLKNLRWL